MIIADDFTGALDTGVQFAVNGASTRVVTGPCFDFGRVDPDVDVLVVDAETRHLPPKQAYDIVYAITKRAVAQRIPYLYKKTDSALRGNIGSELTAMLEAAGGKSLSFLPAFPRMRRCTENGLHYIDGVPVHESVFGKDPFEPVTCSYVPDIISRQSGVPVSLRSAADAAEPVGQGTGPEILVWDAQTDDELENIGKALHASGGMRLTAGCAGFAAVLSKLLGLQKPREQTNICLSPKLLVISGSLNPITLAQLDYAEAKGFRRIRLTGKELLEHSYWDTPSGREQAAKWKELLDRHSCLLFDSSGLPPEGEAVSPGLHKRRVRVAASCGAPLKALLESGAESTLLVIGGDTLLGCMAKLGVAEVEPLCELEPGTVMSRFVRDGKTYHMLTKSGGFGQETLLADIARKIRKT